MARLIRELTRLALPMYCAGCGVCDSVLCPECRRELGMCRLEAAAPALREGLPVWGLGQYCGALRRVVLAWKVGGRRDLDRILGAALAEAADPLRWPGLSPQGRVWVIPVATSWRRRLRGRPAVSNLAREVARGLGSRGYESRLLLGLAGRPMTMRVGLDGEQVVVVDDVLTTGTTMQQAWDAVTAAGGVVLGGAVLAGTPKHTGAHALSIRPKVD